MQNELWIIEEMIVHYGVQGSDGGYCECPEWSHKCGSRLRLVCYSKVTKELLHAYGPFCDVRELLQWAKEHSITLDTPSAPTRGMFDRGGYQTTMDKPVGVASLWELKGDALAEDMQRFCKDLLAKPGAALQFLKDAGIVNSKGKLVKQLQ